MWKLEELEQSNEFPSVLDLPRLPWMEPITRKERYGPTLEIFDVYDAEQYLIKLAARRIKVTSRPGRLVSWSKAIADERDALAWYALAKDVSVEWGVRFDEYRALKHVGRLFGAFLPERIRFKFHDWETKDAVEHSEVFGIKEDVQTVKARRRREKAAALAGIVPPPLPAELRQRMLF
jgi:hypothetical protein